jgi:membrane protein YdbS with pleckstrin-like domain
MKWILSGTLILLALSYSMISTNVPKPWNPMPIYLVLLAWITGYFYMFVVPTVYAIWTYLASRHNRFEEFVFAIVLAITFLNALYFLTSWQYGFRYQGEQHMFITGGINFFGFGTALFVAAIGKTSKSKSLAYTANLILFGLLSWQAFPYLGELP